MSHNPHEKICLWASVFAINVSVAICQLPIRRCSKFGKKSFVFIQIQNLVILKSQLGAKGEMRKFVYYMVTSNMILNYGTQKICHVV